MKNQTNTKTEILAVIGGEDLKEIPNHWRAFKAHYAGKINGYTFSSEFMIYAENMRNAWRLMALIQGKDQRIFATIKTI